MSKYKNELKQINKELDDLSIELTYLKKLKQKDQQIQELELSVRARDDLLKYLKEEDIPVEEVPLYDSPIIRTDLSGDDLINMNYKSKKKKKLEKNIYRDEDGSLYYGYFEDD